jgi:hypothetical protein
MLPLSSVFASANQNEKKHSLIILDKVKTFLQRCKAKVRIVVADSQYIDPKLRCAVERATIPYQANHMKGVLGLLRLIGRLGLMDLMSRGRSIIKTTD